jgi:hypothetical protein
VLQRTFNLVIASTDPASPDEEPKQVEFSMLDQEDFANIDDYIKRHGLNDASMAQERRAKAFNVNKVKGEETNGTRDGEVGEDGLTELQRAEQALQDQEDEEEEDYEASGGESDGEGEGGSEDEEDYDEDGGEEEDEQ